MPDTRDSFLIACSIAFLFGGAVSASTFAVLWLNDKIFDQDEQIKELFSLLEEKDEQIEENADKLN